VPFVAGAVLVWLAQPAAHPYSTLGLAAYAATIVSFLGGIHWGLAMRDGAPLTSLVWGVVPSLVAWPALLMPPSSGLVILGAMLLLCYAVDRRLYVQRGAAGWLTLRFWLSSIAAISCFVGAAGA
jgi:hypothetical protein